VLGRSSLPRHRHRHHASRPHHRVGRLGASRRLGMGRAVSACLINEVGKRKEGNERADKWAPFCKGVEVFLCSLLENKAFVTGLIFHLYRVFFSLGTNGCICIGWSHRLVQMSPHSGVSGSPPRHQVQMSHICTGWWLCLVQMCWPHIYTK
jgi:hypothetical protein